MAKRKKKKESRGKFKATVKDKTGKIVLRLSAASLQLLNSKINSYTLERGDRIYIDTK